MHPEHLFESKKTHTKAYKHHTYETVQSFDKGSIPPFTYMFLVIRAIIIVGTSGDNKDFNTQSSQKTKPISRK